METILGGFTAYRTTITDEEKAVFNKAIAGHTGIQLTPLAVATQPVAGIKYHFFCNGQNTYPNAPIKGVRVSIYQPISGAPELMTIDNFEKKE